MCGYLHVRMLQWCRKFLLSYGLTIFVLCLLPASILEVQAAQVTVAWDVSDEADLAGYKLYYGTASRDYSVVRDVGKVYSHPICDLKAGKTYYFAATAYDLYGNESDFSEELVYQVPDLNNAPIARNGTLSTNQDTAAVGTLTATDPDGDSLTFRLVSQGNLGTVTITDAVGGAYTYTPNAGKKGSDSFTFRVTDARGLSSTATVEVTVLAVNHAPVAKNGLFSTAQGRSGNGVLVATDPDGDVLTYTVATQAVKGTAVITNAATGAYTYTPRAGAVGADGFTFRVSDPGNLTSSATIAVTITAVNQPPVARNGTLSTIQDSPASGRLFATDANGDTLAYRVVSAAKLGSVQLNAATGAFTYAPHPGSTGTDSFTFKANDGKADSNEASFTVTINAHVTIMLEAEDGALSAPMVQGSDTSAGNGKYIWVSNGTGDVTEALEGSGEAVYSFNVPTTATYRVWGRVAANSPADNSFFVSMDYDAGIAWYTALGARSTWFWNQVTDQHDPNPVSFTLAAGMHTLIVSQREDGTKLDKIAITTQPEWIAETVYADAEDGTINGWDVFDADPAGAVITNVFDEDRNSRVVQLAGSRTENGYRLRSNTCTDWNNQSQFVIEWSMKSAESFVVYIEVQTTQGYRCFQYEPIATDYLGWSRLVRLGLGLDAKDGEWHTYVRDLQADLAKAQSGVAVQQVNAFSIRGNAMIDNVKLRSSL